MARGIGGVGDGFAALIRAARKSRKWTQEGLADETGVGVRTIIRWENGETTEPKPREVIAVADVLGIDRADIFRALGWLGNDAPPPVNKEPDPVTEELLVLREAVASILERLDAALEQQERQGNESVTER